MEEFEVEEERNWKHGVTFKGSLGSNFAASPSLPLIPTATGWTRACLKLSEGEEHVGFSLPRNFPARLARAGLSFILRTISQPLLARDPPILIMKTEQDGVYIVLNYTIECIFSTREQCLWLR